MLARNETIIKWLLYIAAAVLCFFVQSAILQRITVWGVIPFIYPLLAAIPATYEDTMFGTAFALVMGLFCDLLLPDAFPCLYTLTFPLVGLCSGLLAGNLLAAGFLCSLTSTAIAFSLTDLFRCLLFWINKKAAWGTGLSIMAREFLVTLPLIIPVTLLFRAIRRKAHEND